MHPDRHPGAVPYGAAPHAAYLHICGVKARMR